MQGPESSASMAHDGKVSTTSSMGLDSNLVTAYQSRNRDEKRREEMNGHVKVLADLNYCYRVTSRL